MRKILPALLLLLLLCLGLCSTASAEVYVLDELYANVDVPEEFTVVLRPGYLDSYAEWLESKGTSLEETTNDFIRRGVLLQCWNEEGDRCFEVTATQNENTLLIFDVNKQSESVRRTYRLNHYPRNEFEQDGYTFSEATWKNHSRSDRFLVLPYKRTEMGETLYRGFMRRTIRNGYEITLDMKIYGRSSTNKDNNLLDDIWDSFTFVEIHDMPAAASAKVNITAAPPQETNENNFIMEGTAAEGVKLTAVVIGLNYKTPLLYEAVIGESGKFKIPVSLPKEGVYMMTVTGEHEGEDVIELAYPITYSRTLLTVNVTSEIPSVIESGDLHITGTSEPGAEIQLFLNSEVAGTGKVTSKGKFAVDFSFPEEGVYDLTLVFSKKGLAGRRITYTVSRKWTDADTLKQLEKEAIKPAYRNLVAKMSGYEGRIMGYTGYIMNVSQSGDEWIMQMALSRKNSKYSNYILVVCPEQPAYEEGSKVLMYGTCVGMSVTLDGEGEETGDSYPCFELLLLTDPK